MILQRLWAFLCFLLACAWLLLCLVWAFATFAP